jgi:hypothetical protein
MALALLSATPTLTHAATIERPLPPPPAPMTAAYLAPFAPQQRMNWLNECHNRLTRGENPNLAAIDQGCEAWLRYYESGGAPDPTYGYVVPVEVSGGMECIPARRQPDRARTVAWCMTSGSNSRDQIPPPVSRWHTRSS